MRKSNNNNSYNRVPGPAAGSNKRAVPAISVGTLRGRRKRDPQHKVVGETVGSEDLEYLCVVKDGFRKASLY